MLNIIQNTIGSLARRVLSIVKDGLKMWLPFSKDGSDSSGNSNNATLYTGKALSFDGTGDSYYVDFGNTGVGLKTLAFWINLDSTTEKVLQLTSTQSIEVSSGTITLNGTWTGSAIYVDATATSTIAASNWKRVVITTTSAITVNDLELGRIGSSYGDFILSDLQIFDSVWTQADVTFDYDNPQHLVTDNSASSIALSNLKGYWHLSEGAGAINYDSSGEDNDGTISGATWVPRQATIPQLALMDWSKGSNMITYSEDFSDSSWTKNNTTVASAFTSPDGTNNAYKMTDDATDSQHVVYVLNLAPQDSNIYTRSVFVKKGTARYVALSAKNKPTSSSTSWIYDFDTNDWTLTGSSGVGQSIDDYGNGWIRLSISIISDSNFNNDFSVGISSTNLLSGASYSGSGDTLYIWGAQFEGGSSTSSYRRTNGTGVTDVTLIAEPNNPSEDILVNSVRLREHSLNLDGSGYAEVPDDASINPTSAITIQCWIKSNTENNKGLVAKYNTDSGKKDYALIKRSSHFRFYIGDTNLDSGTIATSGWVNLAATYDGSVIKTYINGDFSTSTSFSGAIPNNTNVLEIGRWSSRADLSYSEIISDVLLYDTALDADEIENNYNAGLSAHTPSSSFSDDFSSDYGF